MATVQYPCDACDSGPTIHDARFAAVHIIGGDNISQEHLQLATDFMDKFYQQMEDLYGEQMHISLHVVT